MTKSEYIAKHLTQYDVLVLHDDDNIVLVHTLWGGYPILYDWEVELIRSAINEGLLVPRVRKSSNGQIEVEGFGVPFTESADRG